MGFDGHGEPGQFDGLGGGQGGQGFVLPGQIQPADPFLRVTDELALLDADVLPGQRHRLLPGHDEQVAGVAAVHHGLGQAPGRVDEHPVVVDIHRVAGVGDPAGHGVHHDQAAHAHGHVLVPKPLGEPVADGRQAVFAGQHVLVGCEHVFGAHVQLGAVLAGKRAAGGVLADGAAAQGHRDRPAGFALDRRPCPVDGVGEVGRHLGPDDQLLDLGAQGVERFDVFGFGGLHAAVDFRLQVVVLDEALVGTGGDAKPRRHA